MLIQQEMTPGYRHVQGPYVSIVAAATPATIYTISPGREAKIRKIMVCNRNGASGYLQIGTGLTVSFVQSIPDIFIGAGLDVEFTEDMIPALEFTANITAQTTVGAASPADVRVMIEVEEKVGPTG